MSSILNGGDDSHHSNNNIRPNGIHLNGDTNGVNDNWNGTASKSITEQPGFPIAIIGISCRLPGDATNPEKLWELCAQGRDAWSEIPQSRFNSTAFYDSEHEKMGMSNARGAHFMKEDISLFDASFFNFSTDVASTMDPQIRLQLESVFEATENAGLPLQHLAGSKTSVFAGCFVRDYNDSLTRDPDTLPRTTLTGNGTAMISNRVSHFFDLRGPSMTVDTGCSTSLTTLHLGCQSLRTGDADISIVTAANMLINPDNFIILSNLGVLSADGKCFAWDDRANGYGRGEGIATLILKPLKDAIRDGDNVRAVIRETALNQDGKTPTITSPSTAAQEELIRDCYRRAGLDPSQTPYVEAHMTGTLTGDPIEAKAIGSVFGAKRSPDSPVLVGSVKTNLGHMEATSGMAGVIKVVLAFEKGLIPPNLHFKNPNPAIDMKGWRVKVPTSLESWPEDLPRRASVNNFGYGGANAHVILDAFTKPGAFARTTSGHALNGSQEVLQRSIADEANGATRTAHSEKPRIFLLSSKDSNVTQRMMSNLADYVRAKEDSNEELNLDSLAHTLDTRRSMFPWRAVVTASNSCELLQALQDPSRKPLHSRGKPRIGFVFNGQGAQWHAMGRELFAYAAFRQAMGVADQLLKGYGAPWSLIEELSRDEKSSRVHEPRLSQPMCVALQLCLVRLLESWNIVPSAVTSHSSGEIAAAYAVGALTFSEALGIVYFRGALAEKYQKLSTTRGAMLAAGLGPEEASAYIQRIGTAKIVVACINSASSVTLSGDFDAIEEIEQILTDDGKFARKLKVSSAYHSHHMIPMAAEYLRCLEEVITPRKRWSGITYSSPVSGGVVEGPESLGPENWVQNLTQPVLFSSALESMCLPSVATDGGTQSDSLDILLEIGPHGALAGPIRQILGVPSLKDRSIAYASCLTRGEDAIRTMQHMACSLICKGYPVDLDAVNFPVGNENLRVLADLPSYSWNHSTKYWKEPRLSSALRQRKHAPHELLGHMLAGTNPLTPTWRNFLRATDLPWLRDHMVQSSIVLPAAGSICMAIEAMRQITDPSGKSIAGYKLRDVEVINALVVPDTVEGIEVQLSFRQCNDNELDDQGWYEFHLYSTTQADESWMEHSKGYISIKPISSSSEGAWSEALVESLGQSRKIFTSLFRQKMDPVKIFTGLRALGIYHGPLFQNLLDIKTHENYSMTTFRVRDVNAGSKAQLSQEHVVHPTTLDSVFQAAYPALDSNLHENAMVLPRSVSEMYVSETIVRQSGHKLKALSEIHRQDKRGFRSSISVTNAEDNDFSPVLEVKGLFCQAVSQSLGIEKISEDPQTCFKTCWHPDWTFLPTAEIREPLTFAPDAQEISINKKLVRASFHFIHDAIAELSDEDVGNLEWYHKCLFDWMKIQDNLGTTGRLARGSASWAKSSEGLKQLLIDEVSSASVNGRLLCRMGRNLPKILKKKAAPLELMMEGKLLYEFYEKALRCNRSYIQVRKLVENFAVKTPRGRILEIGGGTGGCTTSVLEALTRSVTNNDFCFAHYDFTDISSGFFEQAAKKFSTWSSMMSFKKLDIESDPISQSFEAESYDLVIACQVLHATKAMTNTMSNVRKLLKPGGKMILVETTKDTVDVQLVFGTLPGWWLGAEEERKNGPNLSLESWKTVLAKTGFSGVDIEVGDCEDREQYSFSTILTTAVSPERQYPEAMSIICPKSISQPWLKTLRENLTKTTGIRTVVADFGSIQTDGKYCIILTEMLEPLLQQLDADAFNALRQTLTTAKGALWVTAGGLVRGTKPEYALHAGLLRTLRMEDAGKRLVSLDLEPAADLWTEEACGIIINIVSTSFDLNEAADQIDCEFAVKDSKIHFSRIYEDADENAATYALAKESEPEMREFLDSTNPLRMEIETTGFLDSLRFAEDKTAREPLREDYIEIEPKAFGLNFRDVLIALGQIDGTILGYECSGVVTCLGSATAESGLKVGDRVCAVMQGHFATQIRVHWTWAGRVPDETTFEEAASIPMVFITAYQSLYESANLLEAESVLIHAATGGVGQAAIMLAQHRRAEIFVTVGTEAKRDFIIKNYGIPEDHIFSSRDASFAAGVMAMTKGKGVDVVLNSLAGSLLKESWNCIASFGRFIEIGKRDIEQNKCLDMGPLRRAASFAAIDLDHLTRLRGNIVAKAMREVMHMFSGKLIKAVTPITQYSISEVTKAFRLMQAGKHLGKIVVVPRPNDMVKVVPAIKHVNFSPKHSYLIVGGLGGIGRSLAHHMVRLRCENVVILSRSAESQPGVMAFARELEELGCKTFVRSCDVADASSLARALQECRSSMPPIRGVVQGAMALHDSIFERMSFEQWKAAIRPKVDATWNLHHQLPDLDFFVMLSSLTGVGGSTSQANYSAGSTFQDAFARYRRSQGLPAVSIDLGSVKGVGYVAETQGVVERLIKIGFEPIEEAQTLRIIESAMRNPKRSVDLSQVITGICAYDETMKVAWRHDRRFWPLQRSRALLAGENSRGKEPGSVSLDSLKDTIAAAENFDGAVKCVTEALIQRVSEMFAIPSEEIDAALPLSRYGVDSLVAVEVRNWLAVSAKADASIFDIMQSPSLAVLASKVAEKSKYVADTGLRPSAGR